MSSLPTLDPAELARHLTRKYGKRAAKAAVPSAPPGEPTPKPLSSYRNDPVGFIRDVLGRVLTEDQTRIVQALPGRVKLESGHSTGKSFVKACVLHWWFYTRDPSVVVCSAPTSKSVQDVLWAEVRMLHSGAKRPLTDYFIGPKASEMYHHPDHWARGYTTSRGEAYQGRHREAMLFLFDEDEGIEPVFWDAAASMYQPDGTHGWMASCNPLTTSSRSYLESLRLDENGNPVWKLFTLSALDHPNVKAELAGRKPEIPNAVGLAQVKDWVSSWSDPVEAGDVKRTDVEWPPESGKYIRPGPMFYSRVMGLRPPGGIDTVFNPAAWQLACERRHDEREGWRRQYKIQVGVDASGYGDDNCGIHVRCGPISLHHESHNGWSPDRTAGKVKELCSAWASWYNSLAEDPRVPVMPEDIDVVMEFDGGYGIGVHSHRGHFSRWRGVTAGSGSDMLDPNGMPMYANTRAELWFHAAAAMAGGGIDVSRLPAAMRDRLRVQLLSTAYKTRPTGALLIEPKEEIKSRLGHSPDDADAMILAFSPRRAAEYPTVVWGKS